MLFDGIMMAAGAMAWRCCGRMARRVAITPAVGRLRRPPADFRLHGGDGAGAMVSWQERDFHIYDASDFLFVI